MPKKKPTAAAPSVSVVQHTISSIINNEKFVESYPKFPNKYYLIRDLNGGKHLVTEVNGEIKYIHETAIISDISKYCIESGIFDPQTARFCKDCFSFWFYNTDPIPFPLHIADASDPRPTFSRLGFDSNPESFTGWPASFQSILDRTSQPDALCAFIGSLFYPDADRQQYLYCYGAGQDSKGTLIRFIHTLLGSSCQFIEAPERGDRFFNFKLLGKRVGIMADCDSPKFFGSARFKTLTGGDPIYIEQKGKDGYTMNLEAKFIVASNAYPEITGEKSDLRRIIFVEFEGVSDLLRVAHYEKMLLRDAESIVNGCKQKYMSMCPHHSPIPSEAPGEVVDEHERHYLNILDENFLITGRETDVVSAGAIQKCLSHHKITGGRNIKKVKDIWFRAYPGIKYRAGGRDGRHYIGMRSKDFTQKQFTNNRSLGLVNDNNHCNKL